MYLGFRYGPSAWRPPPFYFVSLPVATLIVGTDVLVLIAYIFTDGIGLVRSSQTFFVSKLFVFALMAGVFPFGSFIVAVIGDGLFAALVFSSLTLGRVLLDEEDWKGVLRDNSITFDTSGKSPA